MSADLSKCYELLGVSPGASAQELKTAHRDMAKVWHPDRFSHDPRLQQKAQEKLKEINEAYDQLVSGKARRQAPSPPVAKRNPPSSRSSRFDQHVEPSPRPGNVAVASRIRWHLAVLPLLIFGTVFFFTSRSLIRQRAQSSIPQEEKRQTSPREEQQPSDSGAASAASESVRVKNRVDPSPAKEAKPVDNAVPGPAIAQFHPIPTVTVMIDPATGLLARPDCPTRSRMTYPSGNEPHEYCNATHPPKVEAQPDPTGPKESRVKSFAKRVGIPGKWFGSGEKTDSSKPDSKKPQ